MAIIGLAIVALTIVALVAASVWLYSMPSDKVTPFQDSTWLD